MNADVRSWLEHPYTIRKMGEWKKLKERLQRKLETERFESLFDLESVQQRLAIVKSFVDDPVAELEKIMRPSSLNEESL